MTISVPQQLLQERNRGWVCGKICPLNATDLLGGAKGARKSPVQNWKFYFFFCKKPVNKNEPFFFFSCSGCNTHQGAVPSACISSTGGEHRPLRLKQGTRLNQQLTESLQGSNSEQNSLRFFLIKRNSILAQHSPCDRGETFCPQQVIPDRSATDLSETVQSPHPVPLGRAASAQAFPQEGSSPSSMKNTLVTSWSPPAFRAHWAPEPGKKTKSFADQQRSREEQRASQRDTLPRASQRDTLPRSAGLGNHHIMNKHSLVV